MISIIVPTYNRATILGQALETILASVETAAEPAEVIVVDNNSSDGTAEMVERYRRVHPLIKLVHEPRQGLSWARNTGMSQAAGEILCFLDDDVLVPREWLGAIAAAFRRYGEAACIAGRIHPKWPEDQEPAWLERRYHCFYSVFDRGAESHMLPRGHGFFGANFALRREIYERLGGFSTALGRKSRSLLSGEDTEYSERLWRNGCQIAYSAEAYVYHQIPRERVNFRWLWRRCLWQGATSYFKPDNHYPLFALSGLPKFLANLILLPLALLLLNRKAVYLACFRIANALGPVYGFCRDVIRRRERPAAGERSRTENPRNVLFVLPRLGNGGAERVVVTLANALTGQGCKVGIALFWRAGNEYLRQLAPAVEVGYIGPARNGLGKLRTLWRLLLMARRYTRVVASLELFTEAIVFKLKKLAGLLGSPKKIYVIVHINLSHYHLFQGRTKKKRMISRLYPKFDRIVAVSGGVKADLAGILPDKLDTIEVIHNPVDFDAIGSMMRQSTGRERPFFVNIGRLAPQKDHGTLLRAFRLFSERVGEAYDLLILGRGPCEPQIMELRDQLGLANVHLLGFQDNPWLLMHGATALVSASLNEGFALIITEALACGTPVIATDCPSGPRELLAGGAYGHLVQPGDAEGICQAMLRVIERPDEAREKPGLAKSPCPASNRRTWRGGMPRCFGVRRVKTDLMGAILGGQNEPLGISALGHDFYPTARHEAQTFRRPGGSE